MSMTTIPLLSSYSRSSPGGRRTHGAEAAEVGGGHLLALLGLALVEPHLAAELLELLVEARLAVSVLLALGGQVLQLPLELLRLLKGLLVAALLVLQLTLQLADLKQTKKANSPDEL
jgi:hypothetical protein